MLGTCFTVSELVGPCFTVSEMLGLFYFSRACPGLYVFKYLQYIPLTVTTGCHDDAPRGPGESAAVQEVNRKHHSGQTGSSNSTKEVVTEEE